VRRRGLGRSDLEVSALSLGSWKTFERIDRDQGLAVMEAARGEGINFLDDARYDDETGAAPIPTGYSEVVFGELFARTGYARSEVVVANKLWWEFWPGQDALGEVEASLGRMGLESLDLIYSFTIPAGLELEVVVDQIGAVLAAGRAAHWAVANWPAEAIERAGDLCDARGVPQPCAAQLPYNLLRRDWVEGEAMRRALERTGASVVASAVLAGGALSGKYRSGGTGRLTEGAGSARTLAETAGAAGELAALAREWGTAASVLALVFALCEPTVGSVLFGATSPAQVRENCAAADLAESLDADRRARLRSIGVP